MLTTSIRSLSRTAPTLRRFITLTEKSSPQSFSILRRNGQKDLSSQNSFSRIARISSNVTTVDKASNGDISGTNPAESAVKLVTSDLEEEKEALSDDDLRKRIDHFQDLFVEARLCIEDCQDSADTTYFDEEADTAQEAVDLACAAYGEVLADLVREEKAAGIESNLRSNDLRRSNGLKVEQLKGELQLVLSGGH